MKTTTPRQGQIQDFERVGLIVREYSGCTLIAIVGVVLSPINCNRALPKVLI